jgi:hypothetical protein
MTARVYSLFSLNRKIVDAGASLQDMFVSLGADLLGLGFAKGGRGELPVVLYQGTAEVHAEGADPADRPDVSIAERQSHQLTSCYPLRRQFAADPLTASRQAMNRDQSYTASTNVRARDEYPAI